MKNGTIIFVINGLSQSGKDTFIHRLIEQEPSWNIFNISSIDFYKQIAEKYFGWDGAKDARGRKLLADLKQTSAEYNNLPTLKCIERISHITAYSQLSPLIIFVHIREPDEIDEFKRFYPGTKTLLIRRTGNVGADNQADHSVESYEYDYDCVADNVEQLHQNVISFSTIIRREYGI